ncbi:hypothetical protein [Brevibacterium spongiae]|uniref:Uncharacterized protein n=1 Tax=Brevibacterium spongiae TaxID=2909672 RepID=A0ABY5SSH1_9MICO|nr:hypothetical protein [Brevibacterium spongiae]UVI37477.1 hypothetical protein L1F31_07475 [Brevibacterium spongiae]
MRRVEPGDGPELQRFRWWQFPGGAHFHLKYREARGEPRRYSDDVRHWVNQSSSEVKAQLYESGIQAAAGRIPNAFPVKGGVIEGAMSGSDMERCHHAAGN